MKLLHRIHLTPLRLAGHLALLTALAPFAFAEEVTKPEGKMPPIKVDPSPLPQVAGTLTTFAPVVEKVAPSVVTISTSKMVKRGAENQNPMLNDPTFRRFFGIPDEPNPPAPNNRRRGGGGRDEGSDGKKRPQPIGLGSGVIVSAEGHVLTSAHVIDGADEILITLGKGLGKPDAISESNGTEVFGKANGYLSVWHMDGTVRDEAGSVDLKDTGTTSSEGVIGRSRHFTGGEGHGLSSKDPITNYPTGYDSHSSEAWFRIEKPNATILAWGNEHAQGKVVMQFRSPPHLAIDCYFSDGNVQGLGALPLSEWTHVVHTYEKGHSKLCFYPFSVKFSI